MTTDRERTNLLFGFVGTWVAFLYYELGRRQRLGEGREEKRREYVDEKITLLERADLAHVERAAQRAALAKAAYAVALVLVPILAVLLAKHL